MPWTVSGRTERMPQGNKRNRWLTIHWSAHPQREQNETETCSYGWLQKGQWYGPAKLDNRLTEKCTKYPTVIKFIMETMKK